jgi:CRISPR-associated endonuclease/helicase Cas3
VEAGVDFSFESVVRVLAGMDNLAQAAGRCNRSNEYGHLCKVYLIRLQDENLSMLQEIYEAQRSTESILEKWKQHPESTSIISEEATYQFYRYLFYEMKHTLKYPIKEYNSTLYMADLLANKNPYAKKKDRYILKQPFKTVAQKFQVFDNETIDILVPYRDGKKWIEKLRILGGSNYQLPVKALTDVFQNIKRYTISIYPYQKAKLEEEGLLESLFDGRIFILSELAYHEEYGLKVIKEPKVEDFIF